MPNNNPDGYNGFTGFGHDQPYGAELKSHELARAAPVPGVPYTNAPQKDQRKAVRGDTNQPQQQGQVARPAAVQPPHPVWLAEAWQAIAATPGASQLVKEQAAIAASQAGLG